METDASIQRLSLQPRALENSWGKSHVSCVFFVVWAFVLLLCLRHCLRNAYAATMGAYAAHTFEGVPTQGQRPCKVMPQHTFFAYAVTLSASFGNLETELLLTPPQSHQRFCSLTDMLCGILQPQSNQAPKRSRHLAATPCSGTSTHIQKRTRNIWLYTIEDSATLDHARGKSSDVFDGD